MGRAVEESGYSICKAQYAIHEATHAIRESGRAVQEPARAIHEPQYAGPSTSRISASGRWVRRASSVLSLTDVL